MLAVGIIPAYAGSTLRSGPTPGPATDHPRIRGEHARPVRARRHWRGSSPHTRGAPPGQMGERPLHRIIPAYAGSTFKNRARIRPGKDHPRIRGEHLAGLGRIIGGVGSSPHTRGALRRPLRSLRSRRIIPAYAGSTTNSNPSIRSRWDHPRIRGEHGVLAVDVDGAAGSSPHTRGAPLPHVHLGKIKRIIPAYAGSTEMTEIALAHLPDHPRIRGEHRMARQRQKFAKGSSPHTRGARAGPQG